MNRSPILMRATLCACLALAVAGCGSVGRLQAVGKAPKITPVETPNSPQLQRSLGGQVLAGRYSDGVSQEGARGSSLFRTGSGAFFHDQRASSIGDILTVRINIADNAALGNSTTRARTGKEGAGLPNFLGLESKLNKILPDAVDPANLVNSNSSSSSTGAGNTSRSEQINTTVAAVVVAVLPNGNLAIEGRQEVRVNYELRELLVRGFVRPQDIGRDNSIRSNQIAEARISYGGRGQITDLQQPRWGQQVYEALFPF